MFLAPPCKIGPHEQFCRLCRVDVSRVSQFSFEPTLCESAERSPEGREWRFELKLDGFRAIGHKSGRSSQVWSRNQKDFSRRFRDVAQGIAELPNDTVIGRWACGTSS
jgi:ATP-dependent DNA ligase